MMPSSLPCLFLCPPVVPQSLSPQGTHFKCPYNCFFIILQLQIKTILCSDAYKKTLVCLGDFCYAYEVK